MGKLQCLVGVVLVAWACICEATYVWTEDFTTSVAANPTINQDYVTQISWVSSSAYQPSVDPTTLNTATHNIISLYHFDALTISPYSATTTLAADSAHVLYPSPLTLSGNITLTTGRYGNALLFLPFSSTQMAFNSPVITSHMVQTTGCSGAVWFKGIGSPVTSLIFEKVFSGFGIGMTATTWRCYVNSADRQNFGITTPLNISTFTSWTHLACSYDPVAYKISLYVNGVLASSGRANLTSGIYYGTQFQVGSTVMSGIIDEVALFDSVITPQAVQSLYTASGAIVPAEAPSFQSVLIPFTTTPNYWDITPVWKYTNNVGSATDVKVEISTNKGITFCALPNNTNLGMNAGCYLPAGNLIYRVTFNARVALDSLAFVYEENEPVRDWGNVVIGINRAGNNYYQTNAMWLDAMKTAAPLPFDGSVPLDSNYYPKNLTTKFGFQIATSPTSHPNSTWSIIANGSGVIQCAVGSTYKTIYIPKDVPATCYNPLYLVLVSTNASNYINNLSVVLQGFENNYTTAIFNPKTISLFKGAKVQRFMDLMMTNGINVANWADRAMKNTWSQSFFMPTSQIGIASIVDASNVNSSFSTTQWKARVTTTGPHTFATGQTVTISGTGAKVIWTASGVSKPNISIDASWNFIEVVDSTNFYIQYSDSGSGWQVKSNGVNTAQVVSTNNKGSVLATINSGAALEYLIELTKQMDADPWFNIPTYATDDYILQFAKFLFNNLPPNFKAYIEYSNELWNTVFTQTAFAKRMDQSMRGPTADGTGYIAKRIAQIFLIFEGVYGDQMSSRIVKVLPSFAAGPTWTSNLLTRLQDPSINPYNISMDVVAIAPYFGGSIAQAIGDARQQNLTSADDVLDRMRDSLYGEVPVWTAAHAAITKQHGLKLVSYEGGPGLAAPVYYTIAGYENLGASLIGANRHPRMRDLVRQALYLWYTNGGELFNYFSDVGSWGNSGSWGALEYLDEDVTTSAKYTALRQVIDMQAGVVSSTSAGSSTSSKSATTATTSGSTTSKSTTTTGTGTSPSSGTSASATSVAPSLTTSPTPNPISAAAVQLAASLALLFVILLAM